MVNLSHCRFYGILDLSYVAIGEAEQVAQAMIQGHVDLIQLRVKNQPIEKIIELSNKLHPITSAASVPLVVNDHASVAKLVPIEGVHVGQDDDSIAVAREQAGRPVFVGKSTHSFDQAIAAETEGADYIGFGPIFATPTKPDYQPVGLENIARLHQAVSVPIFCIGGINIDNLQRVIDAGAERVVMVSALLRARSIVDYARCAIDMLA